ASTSGSRPHGAARRRGRPRPPAGRDPRARVVAQLARHGVPPELRPRRDEPLDPAARTHARPDPVWATVPLDGVPPRGDRPRPDREAPLPRPSARPSRVRGREPRREPGNLGAASTRRPALRRPGTRTDRRARRRPRRGRRDPLPRLALT